jgi:hypothetical protein
MDRLSNPEHLEDLLGLEGPAFLEFLAKLGLVM